MNSPAKFDSNQPATSSLSRRDSSYCPSRAQQGFSPPAGWLIVIPLLLSGCWASTYEQRLQESVSYFEYRNKQNRILAPEWTSGGAANGLIHLRVPKEFVELQPPATPPADQNSAGSDTQGPPGTTGPGGPPPGVFPGAVAPDPSAGPAAAAPPDAGSSQYDPKQVLGVDLPGLIAVFQADLLTDIQGKDEPRPTFLYILSNHDRFMRSTASGDSSESKVNELFNDSYQTLQTLLEFADLPQAAGAQSATNVWYEADFPAQEKYTARRTYRAATITPDKTPEAFDCPMNFEVYQYQNGEIQVVLLFVVPRSVSPSIKWGEKIASSLETLDVSPDKPIPSSLPGGSQGTQF